LKLCQQTNQSLTEQLQAAQTELAHKTEQLQATQATAETNEAKWRDKSSTQERLLKLYQEKHDDTTKKLEEAVAAQGAQAALAQQAREEKERLIIIFNERYASVVQERDSLRNETERLQQRLVIQVHASSAPATPSASGIIEPSGTPQAATAPSTPAAPNQAAAGLVMSEEQLKLRIDELVNLDSSGKKQIAMVITLQQKYETAIAEVSRLRSENSRLVHMMQKIETELEAQAPSFERNRVDYERMKQENQDIARRLKEALTFIEQNRIESTHLQRQQSILKQENDDLAKQVQLLMKQAVDTDGSANGSASAAPSFRNIKELHDKNRELMKIVRELSQEKQEYDTNKELLETALVELNQIQSIRKQQDDKIRQYQQVIESQEALLKQNEARMALAAALGVSAPATAVSSNVGSASNAQHYQQQVTALDARLKELTQTHEAVLRQLKDQHEESVTMRLQLGQKESQLESAQRTSQTYQQTTSLLELQLKDLRQRNSSLLEQVTALEQKVGQLANEKQIQVETMANVQHQLSRLQGQSEAIKEQSQRYEARPGC